MAKRRPSSNEVLELDFDLRLHHHIAKVHDKAFDEKWSTEREETTIAFMRDAYAQCYWDVFHESPEEEGRFFTDNGYEVPPRPIYALPND